MFGKSSKSFQKSKKGFQRTSLIKPFWSLLFLILLSTFSSINSTFAHHGVHHDPPAPVAPQPVAPPPPPPQPTFNFQLPSLPSTFIAPTDTTGIGGGLGMAEGLRKALSPATTNNTKPSKPAFANLPASDSRYQFSGIWHSCCNKSTKQATEPSGETLAATKPGRSMQFGRVETQVNATSKNNFAHIMPSKGSKYEISNSNSVSLSEGSLLAKSTGKPFTISFIKNNTPASVTITGGTMVLVSLVEQMPFVVNLTDKCCSACFLTINQSHKQNTDGQSHNQANDGKQRIVIGLGELAQIICGDAVEPPLPYGSTKLIQTVKIQNQGQSSGTVKLSRFHYIATMRRMNLAKALPKQDLKQVLKSAAAAHHALSSKGY